MTPMEKVKHGMNTAFFQTGTERARHGFPSSVDYIPIKGRSYNLSEEQLKGIARLCQQEQGNPTGAAIEAELIANRYELYGPGVNDGKKMYNYVINSEWWSGAPEHMAKTDSLNPEVLESVRKVLIDGERTIPIYIDEHDCYYYTKNGEKIYDIEMIENNGKVIKAPDRGITNRNNYVTDQTHIYNRYRDVEEDNNYYTYYDTPTLDPFGYTNKAYEKVTGESPTNKPEVSLDLKNKTD